MYFFNVCFLLIFIITLNQLIKKNTTAGRAHSAEFVVSFSSRSLAHKSSWKSHQMTPFFIQKEVLCEKIIIWVKYGNFYTQVMMFSLKKVDDLRAREREREAKGTTNSAPIFPESTLGNTFWVFLVSIDLPFNEKFGMNHPINKLCFTLTTINCC